MHGLTERSESRRNVHEIFVMVTHVRNENTATSHCPIDVGEVRNRLVDVFEKLQRKAQVCLLYTSRCV